MICKNGKKKFRLDPRTKLFLILLCVLSSMSAPSLAYQFGLVVLIALLAAMGLCGERCHRLCADLLFYCVDHAGNDRDASDNVCGIPWTFT